MAGETGTGSVVPLESHVKRTSRFGVRQYHTRPTHRDHLFSRGACGSPPSPEHPRLEHHDHRQQQKEIRTGGEHARDKECSPPRHTTAAIPQPYRRRTCRQADSGYQNRDPDGINYGREHGIGQMPQGQSPARATIQTFVVSDRSCLPPDSKAHRSAGHQLCSIAATNSSLSILSAS